MEPPRKRQRRMPRINVAESPVLDGCPEESWWRHHLTTTSWSGASPDIVQRHVKELAEHLCQFITAEACKDASSDALRIVFHLCHEHQVQSSAAFHALVVPQLLRMINDCTRNPDDYDRLHRAANALIALSAFNVRIIQQMCRNSTTVTPESFVTWFVEVISSVKRVRAIHNMVVCRLLVWVYILTPPTTAPHRLFTLVGPLISIRFIYALTCVRAHNACRGPRCCRSCSPCT